MSINPLEPPLWGARYPRVHREEPASAKAPASPPLAHGRPQQQSKAELEDREPGDDLHDELDRRLGGQHPIARLVGIETVGDEMESSFDTDGDSSAEPAADPPGDDDGADHTPACDDDQERADRRCQVTAHNHASASHGTTVLAT